MKKTLILASLMAFALTPAFAAEQAAQTTPAQPAQEQQNKAPKFEHKKPSPEEMKKRRAEFEQRLKLTEEQKAKAKEIRQKGHEELKPIIDKIQEKRQEIEAVKLSRIAERAQQERIAELRKEIGALKRHAHELRMKNMQEFESILTRKQLRELKKMKEEGRKKFDADFKKHHPQGVHRPNGPRPFGPPEPPIE